MPPGVAISRLAVASALVPTAALAALAQIAPLLVWRQIGSIKAAVAVGGTALLLANWALRRSGRAHVLAGARDGLLLALGVLAGLCWWNAGTFHRDHYVHEWDTYHYYMGAKYFREIGYTRLYHCAVVADAEEGRIDPAGTRTVRDLETNRLVSAVSVAVDREGCISRFSPARWAAFTSDLAWYRQALGSRRWADAQRDHGFNATPVWLLLGHALASLGPASPTQIFALALIDPVLLLAMWMVAWWAFGWRATCVALLFWGTNYPAFWGWTGGGFLRQDWLLFSVLGVVLLRRGQPAAAGAALGVAGLLRVFPWLLLGGVAMRALWAIRERRRRTPLGEYWRLAAGFAAAVVVLVPAATAVNGGWTVWPAFVANSAKHTGTPAVNYVGLRSALSYDHDLRVERLSARGLEDDVFRIWRENRLRVFAERRVLYIAVTAAFMGVIAFAVRDQAVWAAAVLGVGLIPVLVEVSCYYYAIFLAFGFMGIRHPMLGAALLGLSSATWLVERFGWLADTRYAAISVAVLGFVAVAWTVVWRSSSHCTDHGPGKSPGGCPQAAAGMMSRS